MLIAIDAGAENFEAEDEVYEITTSPEDFSKVREEFDMDKASVDICSYGDNAISGTYFICGNKVTKHLQNLSEYVWALNYKNRKK